MTPICKGCLKNYGNLDFECQVCDRITEIARCTNAYIKLVEDRLVLTTKIVENQIMGRDGDSKLVFAPGYQARRVEEHFWLGNSPSSILL